jgi:ElaB/YqjD/DUF883 family membrane-anchored ribosome-binding protein
MPRNTLATEARNTLEALPTHLPSMDRAVEQAREMTDSARREARALGRQTRRYIRDEPVKSTAMAALAGAVIGGLCVLAATRGR